MESENDFRVLALRKFSRSRTPLSSRFKQSGIIISDSARTSFCLTKTKLINSRLIYYKGRSKSNGIVYIS